MAKVAVVGGGIAGLYSAFLAAKAGHEVTIFEASGRLGGAIANRPFATSKTQSQLFDIGAEAFSIIRPNTLELVTELESGYLVVEPARSDARLIIDGEKFLLPKGVLGVPAEITDADLLALVGSSAVELAAALDSAPWQETLNRTDVTVGELVETRLGKAVVERSVAPIIAGAPSTLSTLAFNAMYSTNTSVMWLGCKCHCAW